MGKTIKHIKKAKLKKASRISLEEYYKKYNKMTFLEQSALLNYSRNPSWFNKMFNNRPAKRKDKILLKICKKIRNSKHGIFIIEDEFLDFSINRKPMKYYW